MPKIISLIRGLAAVVDDEDYEDVARYHWTPALRRRGGGERYIAVQPKRGLYLHRLVVKADKGQKVEFRDGNGLNCQKASLEVI